MDYNQRITLITNWFKSDMSVRFNMPRDIDAKIAALDVIEAINSNMPSHLDREQIGNFLASITKEVSRSAKSRTLPTAKEFVDAARISAHTPKISTHSAPKESGDNEPLRIAVARIRAGEPVSDGWLFGDRRKQILKHVTERELERYDLYIAAHKQYYEHKGEEA
jgi:hypothetical protein